MYIIGEIEKRALSIRPSSFAGDSLYLVSVRRYFSIL